MSQLLGFLAPIGLGKTFTEAEDDDSVDRVHHTYTVMILILMSVIVSTKQYVGDPIHCWVPGHFTGNHESYANKACWVSNTYYLPIDERIPLEGERREWINYYQWLPMILLTQAAFFYVPRLVWQGFNGKIGVRIHNLVEAGRNLHDIENKDKNLRYMVRLIDRYLSHYRDDQQGCCGRVKEVARRCNILCGKKYGNFVTVLYMACKLLYLINCLGQLFMMDAFLGTDFHFYGFHAMAALLYRRQWPGSNRFPIFTICDYKVRQMGQNIHRNTLQCVLPINFFNDKLYLVLWFWFVLIAFFTAFNLLVWLCRVSVPSDGIKYIRRHLRATADVDVEKKPDVRDFVQRYLKCDGVTIVRLIQLNCSEIVASELTVSLYTFYKAKRLTEISGEDDTETTAMV